MSNLRMRKALVAGVSIAKRNDAINKAIRYNPFYYKGIARLLRTSDTMGRAQRQALVDRLTERSLRWARAAGTRMPESAAIADWPILEKEDVRRRGDALRNPRIFGIPAATGGNTGIPIQLWRSLRCVAAEQAFLDHLIADRGLRFATARIARLHGDEIKPPSDRRPPFGVRSKDGRRLFLSSQHVADDTLDWYMNELADFKPDILWTYASSGESLAVRLIRRGLVLKIALVISASEVLFPAARKAMESAFQTPVLNHYGIAERVVFAHSAEDGSFWINPAYGRAEILPLQDVDMPPRLSCGEIIATGFWNEAMPFVRYRTGDRLIYPSHYDDNDLNDVILGIKPFVGISGRNQDYLLSPSGEVLVRLDHLPWETNRIVRMQVIQDAVDRVRILVISEPGFSGDDREFLMANVRRTLPDDMLVTIDCVDALERLPSGKTPYVIRRVERPET